MQTQAESSPSPATMRHWMRTELPQIALMLLLLAAARDSFANHYYVPSGSMERTLEIGDRVAVDMRAYGVPGRRLGHPPFQKCLPKKLG